MGTLHLTDRHDPSGRLCALAGRAAAGHDTGGTVCGPCYRDAIHPAAWVRRAIAHELPASDRTNGR